MLSTSGKIADRIAAKKAAQHKAAGPKPFKAKVKAKVKGVVKKTGNKAVTLSKRKVAAALKKLNLKSAGFGRYNKGKGTPVERWVMRNPKNGLYVLADRELRAKLLGRKKAIKAAKAPMAKPMPVAKPAGLKKKKGIVGRPSNARKAHEAKKADITRMHIARLDKKRAETLKAKGKKADAPLTKREQLKRDASVRKLHRVLDKSFRQEQARKKAGKKIGK